MRQIELHPEWANASPLQVIEEISHEALNQLFEQTAEHYAKELPLWQVLNHYGVDEVDASMDSAYVPCKLLSHGGEDRTASAKYFTEDRNTGEHRPAFYCYKCQKMLTSFWYHYTMQRDFFEVKSIREVLKHIYTTFGIAPPLDLWFNFDLTEYFASFDGVATTDVSVFFKEAIEVRGMKSQDPVLYLHRLARLLASAPVTSNDGQPVP